MEAANASAHADLELRDEVAGERRLLFLGPGLELALVTEGEGLSAGLELLLRAERADARLLSAEELLESQLR